MTELPKLESLSEAVAAPIEKAYRAGGLGLSLLTLGAILMLAAYFTESKSVISLALLGTGTLLIFTVILYFYLSEMNKLVHAKSKIRENKELVDAVQQTAIEATQLSLHLQALAFKHADQMARIIQTVRPLMKGLPLVGKFADNSGLVRAQDLSVAIVETTETLNEIVGDLQSALISSDARGLKKYSPVWKLIRIPYRKSSNRLILKKKADPIITTHAYHLPNFTLQRTSLRSAAERSR